VQRLLLSIAISALVSRACSKYAAARHCSTNPIRDWAAGYGIVVVILVSLVVAYPTAIPADMLIDPLGEVEAFAFLYLLPAMVVAWILFRATS